MDSNRSHFLLLNSAADFAESAADCGWDAALGAFMLARRETPRLPTLAPAAARQALALSGPLVGDAHGQFGRLSADRRRCEFALKWPAAPADWQPVLAERADETASSAEALLLDPLDAPAGAAFVDLHLGGDGLLALPWTGSGGNGSGNGSSNGLTAMHLRRRWQSNCELDFVPSRAWVDANNRVWLAGDGFLALCTGSPLPQPYLPRPERFEPSEVNPDPLRQRWRQALPDNIRLLGLCADADWLYLLVDQAPLDAALPKQAIIRRRLDEHDDLPLEVFALAGTLPYATDIAVASAESRHLGELLLLAPLDPAAAAESRRDCAAVALAQTAAGLQAVPQPERWPMRSLASARFVRPLDGAPTYLADDRPRQLYPLAQARFAGQAEGGIL